MIQGKKEERPGWIDEYQGGKIKWILFDSKTDRLKFCVAGNQREAIKKALTMNVIPRKIGDVKPRQGGYRKNQMRKDEFRKFMNRIQQG